MEQDKKSEEQTNSEADAKDPKSQSPKIKK